MLYNLRSISKTTTFIVLYPFKTNDVKAKTLLSWNENIKITFLGKNVIVYYFF